MTTDPKRSGEIGVSPVSAADAVWAAARAVVAAPAYPYPRAKAIFALKEALQDYDDLLAAVAAALTDSSGGES